MFLPRVCRWLTYARVCPTYDVVSNFAHFSRGSLEHPRVGFEMIVPTGPCDFELSDQNKGKSFLKSKTTTVDYLLSKLV